MLVRPVLGHPELKGANYGRIQSNSFGGGADNFVILIRFEIVLLIFECTLFGASSSSYLSTVCLG